ncbi:MAG TPA: ATP-binding protein [Aliidongia sp.]|uniref:ATP-binding protein n=1 Tax=Aliidongia sp. TaxID=1914230 RepID=UPI002DDD06C3|nr:ATP-binding protein [Aliidongia sp.]HEV2677558.1 ATP-binding protein [Aliidongia sp.]
MARRLGATALLARALSLSARVELVEGRHDTGIATIEEALAVFAGLDGDVAAQLAGPHAEAWRVAGNAQVKFGNIAAALPLLERSIEIAQRGLDGELTDGDVPRSIPAASALVRSLNNMGFALTSMREMVGAAEALQRALEVADTYPETLLDVPEDIIFTIGNLVALLQQAARDRIAVGENPAEELSRARSLLETRAARIIAADKAQNAKSSKVTPSAQRDYVEALSRNLLLEGRAEDALRCFQTLMEEAGEDQWQEGTVQRGLAEALLALGRPAEALVHARAALAAHDRNEEVVDRAAVLLVLSHVQRALGDAQGALTSIEEHHRLRARLDASAARQYALHMAARIGLERARAEAEAQRHIANELDLLNGRLMKQALALTSAHAEAERANLAKSAFLANMSHELRTPLNAILGFSEMLHDGYAGAPGPAWVSYAGHINDAGRHLLSVINDVLDLSKIEAGRVDLALEPVKLADIFGSCRELIAPMIEKGELALSIDCDPPGLEIPADRVRLRQILLNLLSNATKFTPAQGRIALSARRASGGFVEIVVEDSGSGMTEDELKIALEIFGQIDSTVARKHEGSGLGLPIANGLAELHGGSLVVRSRKGSGTTVTVSLPSARA